MASRSAWLRLLLGLVIFSAAFGYLEAAVVMYLRGLYTPVRMHFHPAISADDLFPLITTEQLMSLGSAHTLRLKAELGRELATLIMLSSIALIAARSFREWLAGFVFCFGIWDIVFYLSLKLLLNWPASFLTWDILFLLPVPWAGPVIAPLIVAVSMVCAGISVLWLEHSGRPVLITWAQWTAIVLGGAIVVVAFMWDFRNTMSGGMPRPFNWTLFLAGEMLGLLAFGAALRNRQAKTKK